jgi:hypothetical protein
MKLVVLAVLLLLTVDSIVSGDTQVASEVSGDTPVTSIEAGVLKEGGKLRYGDETCLPVILQTLQRYKFVSLLNYVLHNDVWRNEGKNPEVLVAAPQAKCRWRSSCIDLATGWISAKSRFDYHPN